MGSSGLIGGWLLVGAEVVTGSPGHRGICVRMDGEPRRVGPRVLREQAGAPSEREEAWGGAEGSCWCETLAGVAGEGGQCTGPSSGCPSAGSGLLTGSQPSASLSGLKFPPCPKRAGAGAPGPGKPCLCGPGESLHGCLRSPPGWHPSGCQAAGWVRVLHAPKPGGEDGDAGEGPPCGNCGAFPQRAPASTLPRSYSLPLPSFLHHPSSPPEPPLSPSPCCLQWPGWGGATASVLHLPRGARSPRCLCGREGVTPCSERQRASGGVGLPPRPTQPRADRGGGGGLKGRCWLGRAVVPGDRGVPGSTWPGHTQALGELGPDPLLLGFKILLLSGSLNSTSVPGG